MDCDNINTVYYNYLVLKSLNCLTLTGVMLLVFIIHKTSPVYNKLPSYMYLLRSQTICLPKYYYVYVIQFFLNSNTTPSRSTKIKLIRNTFMSRLKFVRTTSVHRQSPKLHFDLYTCTQLANKFLKFLSWKHLTRGE
jgi:hypothetical protein